MAIDAGDVLDVDPACLSYDDRIEMLALIEQTRAALDAQQIRALAEIARADGSDREWAREEVACALSIAPATANGRLHDARDLVDLLPLTLDYLADASIGLRHANVLLEATRCLDDEARAAVEHRVLPRAHGRTVGEFRRSVRRAVASVDPRSTEQRHQDAADQRRVVLNPQNDGMCELWAPLPADGAARLMAAVNELAGRPTTADDTRTADQRRADALVALADGRLAPVGGDGPRTARRSAPAVHVTVALSTLLGADDAPGELAGHGPIPASMARRIAADPSGTWRRILTDTVGRPLDASRTYRPPAALCEQILARDRTCRFPGCLRAARFCEIDHVQAWEHGGATVEANLHALCPRHHHLKHQAGWRVRRRADGNTEWTSPTGRRYYKPPDEIAEPPPDSAASGQ